jgi:hypothetical protein
MGEINSIMGALGEIYSYIEFLCGPRSFLFFGSLSKLLIPIGPLSYNNFNIFIEIAKRLCNLRAAEKQ